MALFGRRETESVKSTKKLDKRIANLEQRISQNQTDRATQRELCETLLEAGEETQNTDPDAASNYFDRALDIADSLVAAEPGADLSDPDGPGMTDRHLLADALTNVAISRSEEPEVVVDCGIRFVATFEELVAAHPEDTALIGHLATEANKYGRVASAIGDPRAPHLLRSAVAAHAVLLPLVEDGVAQRTALGHALADLAWCVADDEAVGLLSRSLELKRFVAEHSPEDGVAHSNVVVALQELASAVQLVDPERSEELFIEAVSLARQHRADRPDDVVACETHANVCHAWSKVLADQDMAASVVMLEEAIAARRVVVAADTSDLAGGHVLGTWLAELAGAYLKVGRETEATAKLLTAHQLCVLATNSDPGNDRYVADQAMVAYKLATVFASPDPLRAYDFFTEAEALGEVLVADQPGDLVVLDQLRKTVEKKAFHAAQCIPSEAEAAFSKALAVHQQLVTACPEDMTYQQQWGSFLVRYGSWQRLPTDQALELLEESVQVQERLYAAEPWNLLRHLGLCYALRSIGQRAATTDQARSQAAFDRAIEVTEEALRLDPHAEISLEIGGGVYAAAARVIQRWDYAAAYHMFDAAIGHQRTMLELFPADHGNQISLGLTLISFAALDSPTEHPHGDWAVAQARYAEGLHRLTEAVREQHLANRVPQVVELVDTITGGNPDQPINNPDLVAALDGVAALAEDFVSPDHG